MEAKFKDLIEKCKNKTPLNDKNVGDEMTLIDRGTFQLVIPSDNTDEQGDFFVYSIKGHDCYSYNDESTHVYHIIDGVGDFIIDDEITKVGPGDTITIAPGQVFTYKGNLIMTFEMTPNFQEKNDHFVKKVDYNE